VGSRTAASNCAPSPKRSIPALPAAFPGNEVEVIHVEAEPDPHDLDVGYAQLASEFNSETADGERRAARDRYAGRTGEAA
jgi:hypothetical protein